MDLLPSTKTVASSEANGGVWGGRAAVRSVLYMAAMSAKKWNPVIKVFYDRLIGAGKKFKVAITACMHKMLIILNSMVRNGQKWHVESI